MTDIQLYRYYRTKNNKKAYIEDYVPAEQYPYKGYIYEQDGDFKDCCWTSNGAFYRSRSLGEWPLDIMSEWSDE